MRAPHQATPLPAGSAPAPGRRERFLARLRSLALWSELIRNLAVRDVETRYKHSLLGLYWAIINPLATAGIFGFVFGVIFHAASQSVPYVVFLLTGLTFWNLFANGVMSATVSVTGNAALLAKIYFPRVVLPTAAVLARFIDFLFSLFVLAVFVALYRVPVHWSALAVVPVVVVEMLFTLGVGYMTAALNVLYRDVNQLVGLLLMVWMYLSPVMFTVAQVPASLRPILLLNPMGGLIQAERDLLFTGHLTDATYLWTAGSWTALVFVGGLYLFKRIEPLFAEVM
ncbi:MAG: ABC transporter permease [Firmicutes bacterium]|nr:ABC transporter permease [Alicyclobacillaceae bacterium]MCL6497092.1 ABC transporter permease [Bacillota bacterium]